LAQRAVSLSNEVQLVVDAIRGVHALTQKFIEPYGTEKELPETISALLVIVVERLRLLDRVVRGDVDPLLLWCSENEAAMAREGNDHVLPVWSSKELAHHHWTGLKRAKIRLRDDRAKRHGRAAKEGSS
jgi:hypothetical protein